MQKSRFEKQLYKTIFVIGIAIFLFTSIAWTISSSTRIITDPSVDFPYSYVIFKVGSTYYAQKYDGTITSSMNASYIFMTVSSIAPSGSLVYVKEGIYSLYVPLNWRYDLRLLGSGLGLGTIFKVTSDFPINSRIIYVKCTANERAGGIENIHLTAYPYGDAKAPTGIYLDGGIGGAGEYPLNGFRVRDVTIWECVRGIYLRGAVLDCRFSDILIYGLKTGDYRQYAIEIDHAGYTGSLGAVPYENWFDNIHLYYGKYITALEIGEDTSINLFKNFRVDGTKVSVAQIRIKGSLNQIEGYTGTDKEWNAGAIADLYISGGLYNIIKNAELERSYALPVYCLVLDDGADYNYIQFYPDSSIMINTTGADDHNTAEILWITNPTDPYNNIVGTIELIGGRNAGVSGSGTAEAKNGDIISFGFTFIGAPQVLITIDENDARYIAQVYSITTTGFDLYLWDDTAGALETVDKTVSWYAKYKP